MQSALVDFAYHCDGGLGMKPWCKIIEVDNQQVLFWVDWAGDEDDEVVFHQQCIIDGLQFDRKLKIKYRADATDEECATFQEQLLFTADEHMARKVLSECCALIEKATSAGVA